jgi:hypothetical protein
MAMPAIEGFDKEGNNRNTFSDSSDWKIPTTVQIYRVFHDFRA